MGDPAITGWLGKSGQAFFDALTPYPSMLNTATAAYREIGDAFEIFSSRTRSLQPQFDSLCTQCLSKLQAITTDGGLPETDAKQLIMNPEQLTGNLMAVASHSSLGSDQFLNSAADKIRAHVIDAANLRDGQLATLKSQTTTARKALLDAIHDAAAMASQVTKLAGGKGTNAADFGTRFAAFGGAATDLNLILPGSVGTDLEDGMVLDPAAGPDGVPDWWTSLTDEERQHYWQSNPEIAALLGSVRYYTDGKTPPAVSSPQLAKALKDAYIRPGEESQIDGDGQLSTALDYELDTGLQVGGRWHISKAAGTLSSLMKVLDNPNSDLTPEDQIVAASMATRLWRSILGQDKTGNVGQMLKDNPGRATDLENTLKSAMSSPSGRSIMGDQGDYDWDAATGLPTLPPAPPTNPVNDGIDGGDIGPGDELPELPEIDPLV
ncbi:hypothetical protein KGQ19_04700 [Catenulispora sp. NL8]|uniref:Uncharacterized protein n=2 Tax=Catenulispora pinistramenti TaxID=2705254 RepID=A0ABS5KKA1_9ACTN|nr:hypothetical protein [Catenulispora pinistramenti]MBS2546161.1 hypothetical protein [Catenulispora pinistramenti]